MPDLQVRFEVPWRHASQLRTQFKHHIIIILCLEAFGHNQSFTADFSQCVFQFRDPVRWVYINLRVE